jgi:hypothetical protein
MDLYITQLAGTNSIQVTFPEIIGIDNLLPFQSFGDFAAS